MKVTLKQYNQVQHIEDGAKKLGFLVRKHRVFLPNKEYFEFDNENFVVACFDGIKGKYTIYRVTSSLSTDWRGEDYSLDDFDNIMENLNKRMMEYKNFVNQDKLNELEKDFEY
jgi:hypothetical protein